MHVGKRLLFICILFALGSTVAVYTFAYHTSFAFISDFSRSESESVLFVGDVMLGRAVEDKINAIGPKLFDGVRSLQKSATHVVCNFESAMAIPHVRTPDFGFQFSVSEDAVALLSDAGVTHANLANNHALDYNEDGYTNAYRILREHNITSFGAPKDTTASSTTIFTVNGVAIGLIGIHAVWGDPDRAVLAKSLSELSRVTDRQIVVVHWGIEYEPTHSKAQEELAEFLVSNGADVIIGHHPHVIQDIALVRGVPVFYSLGNYVFDQYWGSDVTTGLAVRMTMVTDSLRFELVPISITRAVPHVLEGDERTTVLTSLAKRSDIQLSGDIARGVIAVKY